MQQVRWHQHRLFCVSWSFLAAGAALLVPSAGALAAAGPSEPGRLSLDAIAGAKFNLEGPLGARVKANVENWLLVTPDKNPGLLDMFARRDAGKPLDLVPWAGEFVGKYLISAVQALRMSDDPRLRETVGQLVGRLIELQADDGYLGPWPKKERLLGHWDLWGHYHVMLGLMLWHEHTGDQRAMAAARKAADLVCNTFLDTGRRVASAGSHEMNMGIIHSLAILYRKTGEPRYLRMAQEVLKDFEQAGDYYRQGLKGQEYFRTPRPRWESLHSLQGLVELYRITGDETFRRSFLQHWASMRRFDLRNTGGFSSGEQATGNPFANQAIETCCVIAWQAVMLDALRLTGDAGIADDLELATFNAVAGAQHPSGQWCTYNTPINGTRGPSHVQIAFQARPGAMFLNCCSVNGPRGLGMLSEWGVMRSTDGLVVNYYGPMRAEVTLADGTPVTIQQSTDYPLGDTICLKISPQAAKQFTLALRIPAWSAKTDVLLNGQPTAAARPGEYLKLSRLWQPGDEIRLRVDLGLRYESGDLEQAGNVSLYRGPILLCADDRFKPAAPAKVDVARLKEARLVPIDDAIAKAAGAYRPWLVLNLPVGDDTTLRLVDFASAGATGKGYQSWLPAIAVRPPRPVAWQPLDGAKIGPGPIRFTWRTPAASELAGRHHTVVIADSPAFERTVLRCGDQTGNALIIPAEETAKLQPGKSYYWKIVARNQHGQAESIGPYKQFAIDPTAPVMSASPVGERASDRMVTALPLRGDVKPEYGTLVEARGWKPAPGPGGQPGQAVELDGKSGLLKYKLVTFPDQEYTVAIWVSVRELPGNRYGQVFSAWCRGMDDPLRLVVIDGKLSARIEAGQGYATAGVPVKTGQWRHVAAVKQTDNLTLVIDGQPWASARVPLTISSTAEEFALGGNPNYTGPEFLAARLADLRFYGRALSADELKQLCEAGRPK